MNNYKIIMLICILMTCFISAKSPTDLNHIPHYVWDSEESSIGIASVWFQNWTDYQRLHISSVTDSFDFEPHPYAVTTFKKKYRNAIPYKGSNHTLLIGNIEWKDSQNWEEGHVNEFNWLVNRDQNWTYLNKTLSGSAMIDSGKLHLTVKDIDEIVIKLKAGSRPYK